MEKQRDRHVSSVEELVCPWQVVCIRPDMVLRTGSLFSSFTFRPPKHPPLPSSHESSSLGHLETLPITHLSPLPKPSICPLPFECSASVHFLPAWQNSLFQEGEYQEDPGAFAPLPFGKVV